MTRIPDAAPAAERAQRGVSRIVAGSIFTGVIVAVAALASWPIYRSWQLPLLVGVSVVLAGAIAAVAWRRRWGGWLVAAALGASFLLVGVPLAVPSRLGTPSELLRGLAELASGVVFAWKDLVTVELPVGAYRNLLVPALLVFLVGTCAMPLLSWRDGRIAYAAVPVALGMVWFGLFFGRTTVSAPLEIGPVTLYAPLETALGAASLLACLLWLAWRTHHERVRALQRAAVSSGVRVSRKPSRADRRRAALGAAMIAGALVVAVAVVPFAARGAEREVLRTAVGPEIDVSAAVSPLAEYRGLFTDERADEVLFTVESAGELPARLRLATLDAYDGEVFRSGGEGAVDAGRFVRVPSALDAGAGTPVEAEVSIEGLDGIWMPTAGRLAAVTFSGDRAASLADRFYYNADASAGVQTAGGGLEPGDRYVARGVEPDLPALAEVEAPGGVDGSVAAPDSLRAWIDAHATATGGAALVELVELLRERGYLSHGLTEGEGELVWAQDLDGYTFQPSASGHSLARIDAMFARLLERENDPRAEASGNFVAAVGDDEQFAVAVALIARELGFPSRVVLGARLGETEPGLAACDDGVCRGRDLSAWTEVHSSTGEWVPVDVTPQYAQSPSLDVTEQRDPEVVTEVRPDAVEEVIPPDPLQEDSAASDPDGEEVGLDLAWLWPMLRIVGVALLILGLALGPFLVIVGAKATRRRGRRTGTPAARIAGGWEEYVDAAVDAGRDAPRARTRRELAEGFDSAAGLRLADVADRAVFSSGDETEADAAEFWRSVDEERRVLARERGFWRALAVTVSLRSFVRHVAPAQGVRTRFAERGKRRALQPVRQLP
ncbi:transglutaminaseTgpA domain-containing protein [Microbacterium sp. HJ5]